MGKGFQNFMSKKDFHPSSMGNIKKVWEAKQKKEKSEKREAEMRVQYEKEQDVALLGDEKAKIGLSFMYEAPPGAHEPERKEAKAETKLVWKRMDSAPRVKCART